MNFTRTPLSPSRQTSMIWQAPRNKNLRHPAGKQLDSIDNEEQVMVSRRVPNSAGRVIDKPFELKKKSFQKTKLIFMYCENVAVCIAWRVQWTNLFIFSSFPFTSYFLIFFCMSFNLTLDKPVSDHVWVLLKVALLLVIFHWGKSGDTPCKSSSVLFLFIFCLIFLFSCTFPFWHRLTLYFCQFLISCLLCAMMVCRHVLARCLIKFL